jgi:hypothetical protein
MLFKISFDILELEPLTHMCSYFNSYLCLDMSSIKSNIFIREKNSVLYYSSNSILSTNKLNADSNINICGLIYLFVNVL